MSFRDLLLTALTYPDATPDRAIRSGVALARRLGGRLTMLSVRVDLPQLHNPLANALLDLDRLSVLEEARSLAAARTAETFARIAADEFGIAAETETACARLYEEADTIARAARTRDLTLISIGPEVLADRDLAETTLFGSGRPVLVYPETVEVEPRERFDRVAIAWDGSRAAARAVGDALPILHAAGEVRVFTALGDKPEAVKDAAGPLVRHLRGHDIAAKIDERVDHDRSIGGRLAEYVGETQPDLLVMGGYGHARLREFILGGATQSVLESPPCPVLLSH